ncbi:hypothetical protein [Bartonella tamiae]|uniref:Uncharacterized protein n=1 Tax=Bartonella tamiae Th239 TaxID=1094558 RepID=J0ZPE2_9HYPH|nr:hypothetical protein [Bartonella tamiae]EJF90433.1 hypothetical protein ME5_00834 [Bartonella tamiae Th239]EJF93623.1 hypothetical protein MEG_01047 [Bartonella tamiae Th307]
MDQKFIANIKAKKIYHAQNKKRHPMGKILTPIALIVCDDFIRLIAFYKIFLFKRMRNGVITLVIPLGISVIRHYDCTYRNLCFLIK